MAARADSTQQRRRAGPRAQAPVRGAHDRRLFRAVRPVATGSCRVSRFALFYHSLISDWNHGNAHFLRGLMRALQARGHTAVCYEQVDNWSLTNLLQVNPQAVEQFAAEFPDLSFERYTPGPNLADFFRERLR